MKADGCSGKTLGVGKACAADVGFTPADASTQSAALTVTDNTALGQQSVELASAGISGYTSWSMASDTGDFVGGGSTRSWTPVNATITASGDNTGISAAVTAGDESFNAEFTPGKDNLLVPGTTYDNAARAPFAGNDPGLEVTGDGAGCNTITGEFTVQQADFDPISGALEDFAITFVQHCEGAAPALRGSIAYQAPDPPAAVPASTYSPPPPPPTKPGRIRDLTGRGLSTGAALTWQNPSSEAWSQSEVRIEPGDAAPKTVKSGFFVDEGKVPATVVDGLDPGEDYSITVFPLNANGRVGTPESVTVHGTDLSLSTPHRASHRRAVISVRLRAARSGSGLGDETVALYGRIHGRHGAYQLVGTLVTRAGSGHASLTVKLKRSIDIIARFNGQATHIGSAAGPHTVLVG